MDGICVGLVWIGPGWWSNDDSIVFDKKNKCSVLLMSINNLYNLFHVWEWGTRKGRHGDDGCSFPLRDSALKSIIWFPFPESVLVTKHCKTKEKLSLNKNEMMILKEKWTRKAIVINFTCILTIVWAEKNQRGQLCIMWHWMLACKVVISAHQRICTEEFSVI